jgi:hypothetical protein
MTCYWAKIFDFIYYISNFSVAIKTDNHRLIPVPSNNNNNKLSVLIATEKLEI